jgi:hypothetical protein
MENYLLEVTSRFDSLTPEQKDSLISFIDTEVGQLVGFVLGPEMAQPIEAMKNMKPQAMETPMPQEPMVEEPPRRRGLGMRP